MKIGVVTYWYGNSNYGMILQCWALQQYLKRMGHEPYVIRYQPIMPFWKRSAKWLIKSFECLISKEKRNYYHVLSEKQARNSEKDNKRKFQDFRSHYLEMSSRYYRSIKDLQKRPPLADCYVAGSDQIWSNDLRGKGSWGYYLHFGDEAIKRIAYAPSFGTVKYGDDKKRLLSEALRVMNAISCRENDGVSLCRSLGYNVVKVEDPTLLLSGKDYEPLFQPIQQNNHFFIYSVNLRSSDDIYWEDLKIMFPRKEFIVTPASGSLIGGELFGDDVQYVYATVGEWLSLLYNSQLTITSSFHGIVFSILFNKKFAFIPLRGRFSETNNRIMDLLEELHLEDFVVKSPEDYKRIFDTQIDWASVNKTKEKLISRSFCFLKESIC